MKPDPAQRQDESKNTLFRKPGEGFFNSSRTLFPVQAKLSVNSPGDAHEKEADAVADKVMRMPQPGTGTPVSADKEEGVQCMPDDKREEDRMQTGAVDAAPLMRKALPEEDRMLIGEKDAAPEHRMAAGMMDEEDKMRNGDVDLAPLQRKEEKMVQAKGDGSGDVAPSFEQELQGCKGGGSPLPDGVKQQMETGIGADFSNVRIHTGAHAAQLSRSIQAQAFTHGNDIYFNEGKYSPGTDSGKHLLAHELTHTVQQQAAPAVQRAFQPEDAAGEMVGRLFSINSVVEAKGGPSKGGYSIPAGTQIRITVWTNADHYVHGDVIVDKKKHNIIIDKKYLNTVTNSAPGIYEYKAGVKSVGSAIATNEKTIAAYEAQKGVYEKASKTDKTAMSRYYAELKNKTDRQNNRYTDLNRKLIQETMYNAFDPQIKKWVDYYHNSIGIAKKWSKVDYNLVKAMIFQESSIGTAGIHLLSAPRFPGDPKTRFNLTQSIDSSGAILTRMMKEMDPALAARYKLDDVTKDMYAAQKRFGELEKKKNLTIAETQEFAELKQRCNYNEAKKKAYWDSYYWSDTRFYAAWNEFNNQPTKQKTPGKMRNLDYDFWIRTGVRWLYEKRDGVSNWEEAVKAFNGSGPKAEAYKKEVTGRKDAAALGKNEYIPTHL